MAKISNYLENAIINHVLRNTALTQPSNFVSLHTADPGETGASELAGGGYARQAVSAWDTASARATANTNAINFPVMLAAVGTVTHTAVWDAVSGGNLLWYSSSFTGIATAIGRTPTIPAGGLAISMSGAISTYCANAMLDHVFSNSAFTTPGTSIYVSLHDGAVGLTGANEISGNAYARVQETGWDAPSNGATANTAATDMGTPTPSSWGTLTDFGIFDASTSGNFLMGGTLDSSTATTADKATEFAAGALDVTVA